MNTEKNTLEQDDDQLLDGAEKLIWALLDDQITEEDALQLNLLIKESADVRDRYLQCAQVHSDLYSHYNAGSATENDTKSPVLGSLLGGVLPTGAPTSLAD